MTKNSCAECCGCDFAYKCLCPICNCNPCVCNQKKEKKVKGKKKKSDF